MFDGARFRDHRRCSAPRSGKIQPRIVSNAVARARAGAAKACPRHPIPALGRVAPASPVPPLTALCRDPQDALDCPDGTMPLLPENPR